MLSLVLAAGVSFFVACSLTAKSELVREKMMVEGMVMY